MTPPVFGLLASGKGSNAARLLSAFAGNAIPGRAALVLTNVEGAGVLDVAKAAKVPCVTVPHHGLSREAHEAQVLTALRSAGVEHLLLAGYMRVLSKDFLAAFPGAVLNLHPSLLPEFPGAHALESQWKAGVKVSGATVHFVDEGVDTGPVLIQGSRDVALGESFETFVERLQADVEHVIYPRAVRLFVERLGRGAMKQNGWRSTP